MLLLLRIWNALAGQIFSDWRHGKPLSLWVPYYAISVGLASTVHARDLMPGLALSLWSVAFAIFYLEFSGFLIFFERPAWSLVLAAIAAIGSFAGLVLQSVFLTLYEANAKEAIR